jgi:hypothetical protein
MRFLRDTHAIEASEVALLMAVIGPRNHEKGVVDPGRPDAFIGRMRPGGEALSFAVDGADDLAVRPYMEIQEEGFSCFPMFEQRP